MRNYWPVEADHQYRWWEDQALGDGSVKWQTFEHQGILFPPPYVPLPTSVKMKYDGEIHLSHRSDKKGSLSLCPQNPRR